MNMQLSVRHMTVSQKIKKIVRDLCSDVLNKCIGIRLIDVKIEDINGPYKAGVDKRCHLKVRGKERMAIDIEELDEDIHCAIDNAFARLRYMLAMRTGKLVQSITDPD